MILTKNIQSNLSIYDYSNILLGGFDNIIKCIIKLNPDFVNLNVNMPDFVTQEIVYDDAYYVSKSPQIQLPVTQTKSSIKQVYGFSGQSIYDLNLMVYSGFDNIIQFCKDNNINSINDQDVRGLVGNFNTTLNNDLSLNSVIEKKGYVFSTGVFINDYRITESGENRITESGELRIL